MTSAEAARKIQSTLVAARAGGASLRALAEAHELAETHKLDHVLVEVNRHIRNHVPDKESNRIVLALGLGILSGLLTNAIIYAREKN